MKATTTTRAEVPGSSCVPVAPSSISPSLTVADLLSLDFLSLSLISSISPNTSTENISVNEVKDSKFLAHNVIGRCKYCDNQLLSSYCDFSPPPGPQKRAPKPEGLFWIGASIMP